MKIKKLMSVIFAFILILASAYAFYKGDINLNELRDISVEQWEVIDDNLPLILEEDADMNNLSD